MATTRTRPHNGPNEVDARASPSSSWPHARTVRQDADVGDAYLTERGGSYTYMLASFSFNQTRSLAHIRASSARPYVASVRFLMRQIASTPCIAGFM